MTHLDHLEATIHDWKIVAPEGVYDYAEFQRLGDLTRTTMQAVLSFRSTNDNANARQRSNTSSYKRSKHFLKHSSERAQQGHAITFDRSMYVSYQQATELLRPSSEVSYVSFARRIYRYAFKSGAAEHFHLPHPKNLKAALATIPDKTLAECIGVLPVGIKDRVELNVQLMSQIADWCWHRIHTVRDRHEQTREWLREKCPNRELIFTGEYVSREQALRRIVTFLWSVKNGYMPQTRNRRAFSSPAEKYEEKVRRDLYKYISEECGHIKPPITIREIEDYMKPSHRQICPFLPLFAIIGINPVSIFELRTDMLVDGIEAGTKMIRWEKYRANREITTDAWRVLGRDTRTLPNAWQILEMITKDIRLEATPSIRDYLFLCTQHRVKGKGELSISTLRNYVTMRVLNKELKSQFDRRFSLFRHLEHPINLKMLRTTSGVLERFRGDFKAARKFFAHKEAETTTGYLDSPTYRTFLDDEVLAGINHLYAFTTEDPKLVPNDVDLIVQQEGLNRTTASALVADELNLGYGISLTQSGAYVVDTPLNYIRMQKMLESILASSTRLEISNPERWEHYWRPQIALYERALDDFPRKTRAIAQTMDVDIAFPEIH